MRSSCILIVVAVILNIDSGHCENITLISISNIKTVSENEKFVLACSFNIGYLNKNYAKISWTYPDSLNEDKRIDSKTGYVNNTIFSFLEIRNATETKDEGEYICSLTDDANVLSEKTFDVKFKQNGVFSINDVVIKILIGCSSVLIILIAAGIYILFRKTPERKRTTKFVKLATGVELGNLKNDDKNGNDNK